MPDETTKLERKKRSDVGITLWTERDVFALTWIGHQYAIRLDHLQRLLRLRPGHGAANADAISESATRDVVTRWKKARWVQVKRIRVDEPFWVWPTRLALRKLNLPYASKDIEQNMLDDLKHLAVINEIRLKECDGDEDIEWISERQLLQGVIHSPDQESLHRPDGEMHWKGVGIIAIEAELSLKKIPELTENLMELIRGEGYLRLKAEHGAARAKKLSQGERSRYTEIWYFGKRAVRNRVRRACVRLVEQGDLSEEEADRLFVRWYPLTQTEEEEKQEAQENNEDLALDDDDTLPNQNGE